MTTAVALGLMLAFEPKEPGIMGRPPRDPGAPAPDRARSSGGSCFVSGAAGRRARSWLFHWELASGASLAEARTAAVNVFVVVELFYLFNCRSLEHSMFRVGVFSNHWVTGGVLTTVGLQILITYAPFMHTLFHTAPLGLQAWIRIIGVGLCVYAAVGVEKWLRQRRRATRPD